MSSKKMMNILSEDGLSLMEVIIAMAMMAILVMAYLSVFSSSIFFSAQAGDKTDCVMEAASIIENDLAGALFTENDGIISVDGEAMPNSQYISQDISVRIKYDGMENMKTVDCRKVSVTTEESRPGSSMTASTIEVFICD